MSEIQVLPKFLSSLTIWTDYSKLTSCQSVEMASSCSSVDSRTLHTDYRRASVFTEDESRTRTLCISGKTEEMHKRNLALWSPNS